MAELEARLQQLTALSQNYEERLSWLEESQKSRRSKALRFRILLLTILVGVFLFLRFGGFSTP